MFTPVSQRTETHRAHRFGDFVLDLDRESMSRNGHEIRLRPKSFAVLAHLVDHHGRLVTKDELLEAVWGHRHVTEGSLTQCLIEIRRALGDEAHEIVRTVPWRGFIFEPEVVTEPAAEGTPGTSGRAWWRYAVVGAVTLALFVIGGWWGARHLGYDVPLPVGLGASAQANSIAVLPFENLSGEEPNQYFADGLTEEILDALTQVPGLKVIARTSSFAFKGKHVGIPTVADKLNVAYVLEGSVRKSGDMVRITAQLVDAQSDMHLWSRTFDRQLGAAFAVQAEIADLVAETLKLSLAPGSQHAAARSPDPRAYEHYLRGQYFWHRRAAGDRYLAEREFSQAVDLDPGLARAWVGLAGAYDARRQIEGAGDSGLLSRYHEALEKALAADPDLAEAHARLTTYYFTVGDPEAAGEHWSKAQALGPNSVLVLSMGAGWAEMRGLYDEAVTLQRRAAELDPLSAVSHGNLAGYLLAAGRLDEADTEIRQALELSPDLEHEATSLRGAADELVLIQILEHHYNDALTMVGEQPDSPARGENLALAYWGMGRKSDYEQAMARAVREGGWRADFREAEVAAFRGERDRALSLLAAINGRFNHIAKDREAPTFISETRTSPLFIPLRDDPRWQALWDKWREWM